MRSIISIIEEFKDKPDDLDLNCVDPLNRSALIAAIENENIELIRLLLEEGILVKVCWSWFFFYNIIISICYVAGCAAACHR